MARLTAIYYILSVVKVITLYAVIVPYTKITAITASSIWKDKKD